MNKSFLKFCVVAAIASIVSAVALFAQYTFTRQPTQSQKIGFGSVIGGLGTGAVCISSCDGMAFVDAAEACQIGTGSNEDAGSLQYRDTKVLEADGRLGIEAYGNMISYYAMWQDDCFKAGYTAGGTVPGQRFSETVDEGVWDVHVVDGGSDNGESITIDDVANGVLRIQVNDAANDTVQVQLNGAPVQLIAGKELWFKARWMIEDADQDNAVVGLILKSATDAIGTAGADYIRFQCIGGTDLEFVVCQNSTATTVDTDVDLEDETYVTTAFYYDGTTNITIAVNGTVVDTISDDGSTIVFPDDVTLTPALAIECLDTGADWMAVDYVGLINTR